MSNWLDDDELKKKYTVKTLRGIKMITHCVASLSSLEQESDDEDDGKREAE